MGQQLTKEIKDSMIKAVQEKDQVRLEELIKIITEQTQDKTGETSEKIRNMLNLTENQDKNESQLLNRQIEQKQTQGKFALVNQLIDLQTSHLTQAIHQCLKSIVEVQATRKLYLIRQHFSKLALSLMKLTSLEFYIFNRINEKIQYYDVKENTVEKIQLGVQKGNLVRQILSEKQQGKSENKEIYEKIFNQGQLNQKNHRKCVINAINQNCDAVVFCIFQEDGLDKQLNEKALKKLIRIIAKQLDQSQTDEIIKFYSKSVIQVLQIIINQSEKSLINQISFQFNIPQGPSPQSLQQVIKSISVEKSQQFFQSLTKVQSYQQLRFQSLQHLRSYGKYVYELNTIFMDFDEQGTLTFLVNNQAVSNYGELLCQLALKQECCIEKIFMENTGLQAHIKKVIEGVSMKKSGRFCEIEDGLKVKIIKNQQNEIQRIMVLIDDNQQAQSRDSFSTSTLQGTNKKAKQSSKSSSQSSSLSLSDKNSKSSASLIKTLQKQTPGITQTGWLNLFVKDHMIKRNTLSNLMTKKKQTLFAKEDNVTKQQHISSMDHLIDISATEFLKTVDVYSPGLNLLTFEEQYLEGFVRKVFGEVRYFTDSLGQGRQFFDNFLGRMHEGYEMHRNPFHNFTHGVNVMHTCFLICNIQRNQNVLSPLKVFSTVLSGLCHDVGHTGRTNSFQIASKSKKALTYNDLSPLENFHASTTFEILRHSSTNILQSLSSEDYNEIRKDIISNILYTDIKEHFPLIKKFKSIEAKFEGNKLTGELSPEETRTLTGMIVHTSDFGGSAKEFQICKEWSRRVNLQFSAQYKEEFELGIPQTPFFKDLEVESVMAKNEMGFLKVIVFPLYQALNDFYRDQGTLKKLKTFAEQNIKQWQKVHLATSSTNQQKS